MNTGQKVRLTVVRHEQREEYGTELAVLSFLQHVLEDGAPQGFMRALYASNDTPQHPNEGTSEDCSLPSQRDRNNRTECM